jgi:CHAT domain-containing protein
VALLDQGKFAGTEAMLRRALAIRLKALGEGHPDTAVGYSNLAVALKNQGRYAEADVIHRRALAITLQALGEGPDRSADPLALDSDGTITAEQIARTWELDAELVVLSACENGLGRAAGGEGYLGFAQPLLAKGARSLVLSQWKVDDDATALLMTRFYQNLLGRRPGLSRLMPKAEGLDEAKRWLRDLTEDEVGSELAALERGTMRPLAEPGGPAPRAASPSPKATGVRPYAHPSYWASFILIGDPR